MSPRGFFRKLLVLALLATGSSVVITNLTFNFSAERLLVEGIGKRAVELAVKAADALDPSLYEAVITGSATPAEVRVPLVEELRYLQSELGSEGVENLYVIALHDSLLYLIADISDDHMAFGAIDSGELPVKFEVLRSGESRSSTSPYSDQWGTWISGYHPLRSQDGRIIALLGVDLPLGTFPLINQIVSENLLLALVPAILLPLGLSFWWSRRLVRPIGLLQLGLKRIEAGEFEHRVEVNSGDEFDDLALAFNRMSQGLADRERIRTVFHQAVSPEIAAEMLRRDLPLNGESRTITVLFSDIRGFTAMTENMQPEGVITMLNEYFSRMAPLVAEYGGVVDKFVGDEIVAVFGAPLAITDGRIIRHQLRPRHAGITGRAKSSSAGAFRPRASNWHRHQYR